MKATVLSDEQDAIRTKMMNRWPLMYTWTVICGTTFDTYAEWVKFAEKDDADRDTIFPNGTDWRKRSRSRRWIRGRDLQSAMLRKDLLKKATSLGLNAGGLV